MKMTFLGVGSFFANGIDDFHSNILLENDEGKSFLIDAGTDLKVSIAKANKKIENIDSIYISHEHGDHCGALEYLGFYSRFITKKKINFYSTHRMAYDLWDENLRGSMEIVDHGVVKVTDYFNVIDQDYLDTFSWSGLDFEVIPMPHIPIDSYSFWSVPSYGLFIKSPKNKILITTDTFYTYGLESRYLDPKPHIDRIKRAYEEADIIFHDCETYGLVNPPGSDVHAHYEELVKFDSRLKNKIWLYHYQNLKERLPSAIVDGFRGFVTAGQEFEI